MKLLGRFCYPGLTALPAGVAPHCVVTASGASATPVRIEIAYAVKPDEDVLLSERSGSCLHRAILANPFVFARRFNLGIGRGGQIRTDDLWIMSPPGTATSLHRIVHYVLQFLYDKTQVVQRVDDRQYLGRCFWCVARLVAEFYQRINCDMLPQRR